MLIYPIQGMWHHIKTRAACDDVKKTLKHEIVKIACFCGDKSHSFNTSRTGDFSTFCALMLNSFGTGKFRIRAWTLS